LLHFVQVQRVAVVVLSCGGFAIEDFSIALNEQYCKYLFAYAAGFQAEDQDENGVPYLLVNPIQNPEVTNSFFSDLHVFLASELVVEHRNEDREEYVSYGARAIYASEVSTCVFMFYWRIFIKNEQNSFRLLKLYIADSTILMKGLQTVIGSKLKKSALSR
jgi:hypothetical protein